MTYRCVLANTHRVPSTANKLSRDGASSLTSDGSNVQAVPSLESFFPKNAARKMGARNGT
jgi:hypothetical protein